MVTGGPTWNSHRVLAAPVKLLEVLAQQLAVGAELLRAALDLLGNPQELYRQAPDGGRRQLNRTFYDRRYLDDEIIGETV